MFCFFFQAEDGIRDIGVTGVQTCALPISKGEAFKNRVSFKREEARSFFEPKVFDRRFFGGRAPSAIGVRGLAPLLASLAPSRSEERRVGKECRSRWSPYH